jgi:hypothetical protein
MARDTAWFGFAKPSANESSIRGGELYIFILAFEQKLIQEVLNIKNQ